MSYEAIITREGDAWLADIPAVPGAHTYARSLPSLFDSIREVIILMDDLPDDASVEVSYRYDVNDVAVSDALRVGDHRKELLELRQSIESETQRAVDTLKRAGYSVRDAAALVGITPGRVSQLANQHVRATARQASKPRSAADKRAGDEHGARRTPKATAPTAATKSKPNKPKKKNKVAP